LIIDPNNRFVSQRETPSMTLIDVDLTTNGLVVTHRLKPEMGKLVVPFWPQTLDILTVTVWDDSIEAVVVNDDCSRWLSEALSGDFRLVFMPDTSVRTADRRYAPFDTDVSFADGFAYLLIGQSSLDKLNSQLEQPVEMLRFRPNFVVTGGNAHEEDSWHEFTINDLVFWGVKPCARCIMTTIDLQTATIGKEPLKTLGSYRKQNNKILFGQNVITKADGVVKVGDLVTIMRALK
jgi:uncharacterized protein